MTAHAIAIAITFDEIDHLFDIIKQEHPHIYQWYEDDEDGNLINFVNKKNRILAQYFRNENHVIFYDANKEDSDSDTVMSSLSEEESD